MAKIDLIIPAYNAYATIDRAIGSILAQTICNDIKVTIVNDASTNGSYEKLVERYSPVLSIQCLDMPQNGGPGVARQYGIDRTDCEYMMFMDADDTFGDTFSAENMLSAFENEPDAIAVFGGFDEETESSIVKHEKDCVWMHGKMYKRSFWDFARLRFHSKSRANEDNGVNTIIKLTAPALGFKIITIPNTCYVWHYNNKSITRNNDYEYYFTSSFSGYVTNMIYAINESIRIAGRITDEIKKQIVGVMCYLYCYWNETVEYRNDYANTNLAACTDFYQQCYKKVAADIPYGDFTVAYNRQMQASLNRFPSCIPTKTIYDFINDLKKG